MKIENCEFNAVKFDGRAIDAINNVSKALLNLTEIFKMQDIEIECLVKIEGDGITVHDCHTNGTAALRGDSHETTLEANERGC